MRRMEDEGQLLETMLKQTDQGKKVDPKEDVPLDACRASRH